MQIRRLTAADASDFRDIRLEALRDEPGAFGSDYAANLGYPLDRFRQRLEDSHVLGAWGAARLEGCLALDVLGGAKMGHRGAITSVYVRPDVRRRGIARGLMAEAERVAADAGLSQLELFVSSAVPGARVFYETLGFRCVGSVPDALRVEGQSFAEDLMVRVLEGAGL